MNILESPRNFQLRCQKGPESLTSDIVHVVQFVQRKFDLEQPVQASLFASEITPQNPERVIFPNVC